MLHLILLTHLRFFHNLNSINFVRRFVLAQTHFPKGTATNDGHCFEVVEFGFLHFGV